MSKLCGRGVKLYDLFMQLRKPILLALTTKLYAIILSASFLLVAPVPYRSPGGLVIFVK